MYILGIESSCDDTAVAVIKDNKVLSHTISSQIDQHRPFGGVVPEIAARSHISVIDKLVELSLEKASLSATDIDLVAATGGPGLIGGVITSVMFAKGFSIANDIPFCAINHLEAHCLVARMDNPDISFPFLLFLASGGHCQILMCLGVGKYIQLGATRDDAIGEAFDKTAKILGLPYPGGPEIEEIAKNGDSQRYNLPNAMNKQDNCDFSLSGLKTAVRYLVDSFDSKLSKDDIANVASSFQLAISNQIESRLNNAIQKFKKEYNTNNLVFAGGVAANSFLRDKISKLCKQHDFELIVPKKELCTDNGIMVAWAGYENYKINNLSAINFKPRSKWLLHQM